MWGQTLNEHSSEVSGGTYRMTQQNYISWMGACRSRVVLQQLLAWAGTFPTVQKCMVRQVLQGGHKLPLSGTGPEGCGKRVRLNGA
jgi:hypothetical protein